MKSKRLVDDESGVSPVIGVILMVAITVILAAVIGTFVLDLGNQVQSSSPTASFSFDESVGNDDTVQIVHDGGDTISGDQLSVNCGSWSGNSISAGDTTQCDMSSVETVQVVWESTDGSNSQILAEYETD
ncbi:type IV pilin [Halorussus halobius]|uniref:type IV pilin n=1 Tax=Halorussus halobius TaxID=1710537 RepID=UPI001091E10D|nr:type IV pilin N-terminal domain-containing protein [Halorussus halobius]